MLWNWTAFSKQDDIRKNNVQTNESNYSQPDQPSKGFREVELQHKCRNTQFEGRHSCQIEELTEPQIHQVLCEIIFGDGRVPSMLAGTNPR